MGSIEFVAVSQLTEKESSFHSISFPSEWGERVSRRKYLRYRVSIQLVSPASGERDGLCVGDTCSLGVVSIQLVSPASGEMMMNNIPTQVPLVSIQLVSPASGE